ncbi:CHAD domain-containing protein [Cellulomonas alba]|uniref:CHAD domain-containing protein n=1 Tax=Cellulomonas alba TaxID=3053467 RepID=A0ABT7SIG9_9CELL|nr:CHAD domain-containing protein [Cellulomonas alba]MDM7855982.1 CHAD domain-containing protein [Cellulomonas alba]
MTQADPRTGADLVGAYLRAVVDDLLAADPLIRADEPDAVHKARVATRRLRSALRTFRGVLDRTATDPLRAELRWWGGVLGGARDREVQRDRVRAVLDGLAPELVVGPVHARVTAELDAGYHLARAAVVQLMDHARYGELVDGLRALADAPPFTERAERSAATIARRACRSTWRRARRAHRVVDERVAALEEPWLEGDEDLWTADPAEPENAGPDATDPDLATAIHELRKAAKAARYAGEACAPALGDAASAYASAFEALQDLLGAHHDAVVLHGVFRDMGMRAHLDGENGFTYGLLVGLERARAQGAVRDLPDVWRVARRERVRRH